MRTVGMVVEVLRAYGLRARLVEWLKITLVVSPLQRWYRKEAEAYMHELRKLPVGTVGRDVVDMLDDRDLLLIPKFEDHDVKHLLLDYGMSPIDEIRMQCYLLGNGNRSMVCLVFVATAVLFPEYWSLFREDYNKGNQAPCILHVRLREVKAKPTEDVKARIR